MKERSKCYEVYFHWDWERLHWRSDIKLSPREEWGVSEVKGEEQGGGGGEKSISGKGTCVKALNWEEPQSHMAACSEP